MATPGRGIAITSTRSAESIGPGDHPCDTGEVVQRQPASASAKALLPAPLRLALLDDEEMVLEGLAAWLSRESVEVHVAVAASQWAELLIHPAFPVDVVLLDLQLRDGIPAPIKVTTLRTAGVASVIISTHATAAEVRACVNAGALGYLPKSEPAAEMIRAAQHAGRGESYITPILAALLVADREGDLDVGVPQLSPQELRALTLYASGLPMKNVARRLNVTYDTAKSYVDRVREKYEQAGRGARTKVELYQRALEDGLLSHDPWNALDAKLAASSRDR
jgi:two-component system uhpT operon response regulator UhpA